MGMALIYSGIAANTKKSQISELRLLLPVLLQMPMTLFNTLISIMESRSLSRLLRAMANLHYRQRTTTRRSTLQKAAIYSDVGQLNQLLKAAR
jgi:hypothetical protein